MLRLASALAILVASTSAFSTTQTGVRSFKTTTALCYHSTAFDRAVDCANRYGMCDVDELLQLSEELEKFQGCFYETDAETCTKEIDDRKDLADALLMQGELRERNHYVQEGNLFAYDVKADSDMHDRDDFFDRIAPALDI
mmetsp:Transcript_12594/g.30737  ORF Transcript_12594/g.30737 Transcript_12594/m.30737 type:complete len:141 (+) Transcript_12594:137-559(+)